MSLRTTRWTCARRSWWFREGLLVGTRCASTWRGSRGGLRADAGVGVGRCAAGYGGDLQTARADTHTGRVLPGRSVYQRSRTPRAAPPPLVCRWKQAHEADVLNRQLMRQGYPTAQLLAR